MLSTDVASSAAEPTLTDELDGAVDTAIPVGVDQDMVDGLAHERSHRHGSLRRQPCQTVELLLGQTDLGAHHPPDGITLA